jgi:hypothetical protein
MLDIRNILAALSVKRPLFHSEADFQHALAWEIHQQWLGCSIRLEFKPPNATDRTYIDIWVKTLDILIAIELKYKTRTFSTNIQGEDFNLSNHSAPDQGRYDFLKDIQRLEQIVYGYSNAAIGYAIFLSNDPTYWKLPLDKPTADAQFRIHQNRTLTGELNWGTTASSGSTRGREKPIIIKGSYTPNWLDFSKLNGLPQTGGDFKYLLVKVDSKLTS